MSSPYTFDWDTRTTSDGGHLYRAIAYDLAGNKTLSDHRILIVDNTVPTISITAPANGATVPRSKSTTIGANVTDNVQLYKAEFLVNGIRKCTDKTAPFTCKWKVPSVKKRPYAIQIKAYDKAGNIGTSVVNVISSN